MQPEDDKTYKVGYGKPPAHTQFKKGQSGNPKGRPKRDDPSWTQALPNTLEDKILVTIDGKQRELTMQEIFVERVIEQCLKGNKTAIRKLLALRSFVHKQGDLKPVEVVFSGADANL